MLAWTPIFIGVTLSLGRGVLQKKRHPGEGRDLDTPEVEVVFLRLGGGAARYIDVPITSVQNDLNSVLGS
jgi:hypothetical protein